MATGNVNNGEQQQLAIAGVHDGIAGVQTPTAAERDAFGAKYAVSFQPNMGRAKARVGSVATLGLETLRIVQVGPSRAAAGLINALLAEV